MQHIPDDPEAFCRQHWRPLAQSLAVYTDDVALGQDLAQEALARVLVRWSRVRTMRSPGGYAYRIGVNLARDVLRERQRTRPGGGATGHAEAQDPTTRMSIDRALAALPPRQRLAMSLRHLADLSVAQTAHAMGCRPGTVKALCHQAAANLRTSPQLDWHPASPVRSRDTHEVPIDE